MLQANLDDSGRKRKASGADTAAEAHAEETHPPSSMIAMLQNECALLKQISTALNNLLQPGGGLVPLVAKCRRCPNSLLVRDIRCVVLRLSSNYFRRFIAHYQCWPWRWIQFLTLSAQADRDEFLDNLADSPLCCLDGTFTLRAIQKVEHLGVVVSLVFLVCFDVSLFHFLTHRMAT